MTGDAAPSVTLRELEAAFSREIATAPRAAAETAYALAFRYRNADVGGCRRFDLARIWAQRSIDLLDALPSGTVADVVSTHLSVGGVEIPNLLHSGVVRERLGDVLV